MGTHEHIGPEHPSQQRARAANDVADAEPAATDRARASVHAPSSAHRW